MTELKTNRGLFKFIIFSILTIGIYSLYFIHAVAHDVNTACEGKDTRHTMGLLAYFFLNIITFGIFGLIWNVTVCNRMHDRIENAGEKSEVSGLSWFLWNYLGALLFGIGILVAQYKLIHALNHVNSVYNSGK